MFLPLWLIWQRHGFNDADQLFGNLGRDTFDVQAFLGGVTTEGKPDRIMAP